MYRDQEMSADEINRHIEAARRRRSEEMARLGAAGVKALRRLFRKAQASKPMQAASQGH